MSNVESLRKLKGERAMLSRVFSHPADKRSYKRDSLFVLQDTRIGVEFEWEGVLMDRLDQLPSDKYPGLAHFAYHEDHSLKDHGAEYVFSEPLFGADAQQAIDDMLKFAAASKWKTTKRTGLHVHMDVRDIDVLQLKALLILYALFEKAIFKFAGDGREHSIFCVPWYRSDDALTRAAAVLRGATEDAFASPENIINKGYAHSGAYHRYAGLNLASLSRFGSIEFRHLKATHDRERIYDWVNIILSLKEAAMRVPTSDGALIRGARDSDGLEFLEYVFGKKLSYKLLYANFKYDLKNVGVPNALDLVRASDHKLISPEKEDKSASYGVVKWPKGSLGKLDDAIVEHFIKAKEGSGNNPNQQEEDFAEGLVQERAAPRVGIGFPLPNPRRGIQAQNRDLLEELIRERPLGAAAAVLPPADNPDGGGRNAPDRNVPAIQEVRDDRIQLPTEDFWIIYTGRNVPKVYGQKYVYREDATRPWSYYRYENPFWRAGQEYDGAPIVLYNADEFRI